MSDCKNDNCMITVIVPVYNVESYLEECLESLTVQTIGTENIEVIMINDCSTDSSGSIMDSYSRKYNNFISVYMPQNTGGAGIPRNTGISRAKGNFIMFLDSDDKYFPYTCETMYNAINKYGSDIVISGHNYFSESYEGYFKLVDEIMENKSLKSNPELLDFPTCVWSKIYRKEMLLKHNISFPDNAIGEDAVFFFKCLLTAEKITVLPTSIYKYRIRNNNENPSLTQKISKSFFTEYNNSRKLLVNLSKEYKYDYLAQRFHRDMDYFFWNLNKPNQISRDEITVMFEDYYWLAAEGEKYLSNCRISDSIIIKKILKKDFEGASMAFLSFSELRELEATIVNQQKEIEALNLRLASE